MNIYTSSIVIAARRLLRRLGLTKWMAFGLWGKAYEDRFAVAMIAALRGGDCVWDVGANVGHYTQRFANIVGTNGVVYAFEPSPENLKLLQQSVQALVQVKVCPYALGNLDGHINLSQGNDSLGATSRVGEHASQTGALAYNVPVARGISVVEKEGVKSPNVIKIDTEGFELEVIRGMGALLTEKSLRVVCVEVHFAILDERGTPHAPVEIAALLTSSGFGVRWADASHLIATRPQ